MKKKRKVKDEPIFLDDRLFDNLKRLLNRKEWPYKTNKETYILRDKALICFLLLSGARVSRALRLQRKHFRIYPNRIVLAQYDPDKSGLTRTHVTLPKSGKLSYFTGVFEEWLIQIEHEDHYVFPSGSAYGLNYNRHLSRYRAHTLIKYITGKFPHWYRAVCANIYAKYIFNRDAWKLKQFMGWKRLESSTPYVEAIWKEDEHKIFTF